MAYDVRIAGTDLHFSCGEGEHLLDAALKAGIEMPYSCRKGVCGNCAGGIAAGAVQCPPTDVAGPGQVLFCQCLPLSDLEIAPTAWHRSDPAARQFKAGQYLQVELPDGSRRSYSMANPPHESDTLQLHIRHVAGGQFTQIVPTLKAGDLLQVELPFGNFELKEETSAAMLCVVGGTGFAPVKSLLDDLLKKGVRRPVTLVWGGRNAAGLYLMSAVERWKKLLPGFVFIAAVEDAADAQALGGFQGRVDDAVRAHCPTLAGHEVYCCGAPPMVAAVKKACVEERGLDARYFFSDVFVPGPAVT